MPGVGRSTRPGYESLARQPLVQTRRFLNINVAVMGHVDVGKTTLVRFLSEILSTAALDKHPASRELGRTIDLGFSCTRLPASPVVVHLVDDEAASLENVSYEGLQLTWIDCPGHASLLRTVLLGASVMDLLLLVVDASAGIQAQTLECLALAAIFTKHVVVALHKCDRVRDQPAVLEERLQQLQAYVSTNRWWLPTPLATIPTWIGTDARRTAYERHQQHQHSILFPAADNDDIGGVVALAQAVQAAAEQALATGLWQERLRLQRKPYALFAVDHAFEVTGQGTVLTGILLTGRLRIGEVIHAAFVGAGVASTKSRSEGTKKRLIADARSVRSIQVYRSSVSEIVAGDRAALGLTPGAKSGSLAQKSKQASGNKTASHRQRAPRDAWERGLVYAPANLIEFYPVEKLLMRVQRVLDMTHPGAARGDAFSIATCAEHHPAPGQVPSLSRQWQLTLALTTVPGRVTHWLAAADAAGEYECLASATEADASTATCSAERTRFVVLRLERCIFLPFELGRGAADARRPVPLTPFQVALLSDAHWEAATAARKARLERRADPDGESPDLRLRFVLAIEAVLSTQMPTTTHLDAGSERLASVARQIRVYRRKERVGRVERFLQDGACCLVRDLFDRDLQHPERILGLRVRLELLTDSTAQPPGCPADTYRRQAVRACVSGRIVRTFGQRGKVVVQLERPVSATTSSTAQWLVRLRFRRPVSLGIPDHERAHDRHSFYQAEEDMTSVCEAAVQSTSERI